MDQQTNRDLVVGVQSLTIAAIGGTLQSSSSGFYAFVDSAISHIWLPLDVCRVFEKAFGIVYDPSTELYLVNETLHSQLLKLNASVSFSLTMTLNSGPSVTVTLPYSSLDLLATNEYPGLVNASHYLPIRRAANESQFTLGRAFLQNAYLIVDYEHSNFSIQQRAFNSGASQNLTAILPSRSSVETDPPGPDVNIANSNTPGLQAGTIAGIVVGGAALVLASIGIFIWLRRRLGVRPALPKAVDSTLNWDDKPELEEQLRYEMEGERPEVEGSKGMSAELPSSCVAERAKRGVQVIELDASGTPSELHSTSMFERPTSAARLRHELE
jgi:hypothetical protein